MAVTEALTGNDLTLADVWAVGVEGRPAAQLSEDAREQKDAVYSDALDFSTVRTAIYTLEEGN